MVTSEFIVLFHAVGIALEKDVLGAGNNCVTCDVPSLSAQPVISANLIFPEAHLKKSFSIIMCGIRIAKQRLEDDRDVRHQGPLPWPVGVVQQDGAPRGEINNNEKVPVSGEIACSGKASLNGPVRHQTFGL
jgi:hypothetical protein